jgi:deoxyribonuclease V
VEQVVARAQVRFPYVPGLLSFREIPVLLPCFERLRTPPDLVIVDGQGIAHPRRLGLAAHLGLLLDLPSIGCAKSRLTGHPAGELAPERGARVPLVDRGETVGYALRTRAGTSPVFVSTGHRIGLDEAAAWVLACATRFRLPEPTRLAHQAAAGRQIAPPLESDEGTST